MRNVYLAAVVVTLLVSAVVVSAEPSMMGYSGLLMVPTTDTVKDGGYNVAISSSELSDWDDRAYIANFGLRNGLEAGIWWWHPGGGGNETVLNVKYQFESGAPGRPSLAVGVSDITDEIDTALYLVASKDIGHSVRATVDRKPVSLLTLHGGIGGGGIDDFFFGLEARLADRLTLIAEHFNDDLSVGARLRLWRHVAVDAGYISTKDWSANLSYNYPLGVTDTLQPVIGE